MLLTFIVEDGPSIPPVMLLEWAPAALSAGGTHCPLWHCSPPLPHPFQLRYCDSTVLLQLAEAARPGFPTMLANDLAALVVVRGWAEGQFR